MKVKYKISFTCDNLMVDRIINRQKARGYIPDDYRTVMILNSKNEIINYKEGWKFAFLSNTFLIYSEYIIKLS